MTRAAFQEGAAKPGTVAWLLLCALLPISGEWITIPLVVAIVCLLISRIGKPFKLDGALLWPLFVFYGLHVLGMAWSTDIGFGLFDLQIKLGLVLLPLAAAAYLAVRGEGGLRESMVAFAAGTVVALVLSLGKALTCYGENGWIECFTQSYFSFEHHPSYAAWYAVWAVAYWAIVLVRGEIAPRWRPLVIGFLVLALVFAVMLASKSGLLGLLIALLVVVWMIWRNLKGTKRWTALVGLVLAVAIPGYLLSSVISTRTSAAVHAVEKVAEGAGDPAASVDGSDDRLIAWTCSWELLKSNPFGAGTGDIKHALVACYEAKGAQKAATLRLNSHSQFLQGGVALGWAGLISALLVGGVPLALAWRRRNLLLGIFACLFLLNAAVESVLEVQAGVVFFGLFIGLLAQRRSLPGPH